MISSPLIVLFFVALQLPSLWSFAEDVKDIPITEIGSSYRFLGKMGSPLGTMMTLEGIVVDGNRYAGDSHGPVLQVQKINGRASQKCIEISIRPYRTDFGKPYHVVNLDKPSDSPDPERSLPRLNFGTTYRFWGYETGSFVGEPDEAGNDGGIMRQSAGFYFQTHFVVVKGKEVSPIFFTPADFLKQRVLMHGKAMNADGKAWLGNYGWRVSVSNKDQWPDSLVNKDIRVLGVPEKEPNSDSISIKVEGAQFNILESQIDQEVKLRGQSQNINGHWYLYYNGHHVFIENSVTPAVMKSLDLHAAVEVKGKLEKKDYRDAIFNNAKTQRTTEFIIHNASIKILDDLLPVERELEPDPWSIGTPPRR